LQLFEDNSYNPDISLAVAERYIDIDSFIDAHIANIFFGNIDWPANNVRFWRYNGTPDPSLPGRDGRWRWMLIDLDSTTGYNFAFAYNEDNIYRLLNMPDEREPIPPDPAITPQERELIPGEFAISQESTVIFRALMQNEAFRAAFVNRFTDIMNTYFAEQPFLDMIEKFSYNIRPVMPEQIARYGRINSMEDWENQLEILKTFAANRQEYMLAFLYSNLDLGETVTITTQTNHMRGRMAINGILLDQEVTPGVPSSSSWSGIYFEGMTQTISAVPLEGYRFVSFTVTKGGETETRTTNPLQIEITSDTIIEARFIRG